MKNKNGFTLVELLVTITLLVLLFILVIPMSLSLINKSNQEQCEKLANMFVANAELCVLDFNTDICVDSNWSGNATEWTSDKYVSLTNLYNHGYIEDKYENSYTNETLNVSNNFGGYYIRIKKVDAPGSGSTTASYLEYKLTKSSSSLVNPCE